MIYYIILCAGTFYYFLKIFIVITCKDAVRKKLKHRHQKFSYHKKTSIREFIMAKQQNYFHRVLHKKMDKS